MGNTIINPTRRGTSSLLSHIKARTIMAIVGIEFRNFNIGIIKLYISFETDDILPIIIAENKDIRKPIKVLSNVCLIILRKLGSLIISIILIKVLLTEGIITWLFTRLDSNIHRIIIQILRIVDNLLSFKVDFITRYFSPYKIRCKI